ncbi:MAG: mycofactocin biosynthesis glycosyltransferase MftF [Desulfuromonadales bacterium]
MIYRLAEGVTAQETTDGGFLVASRPLRMLRLNPSLLKLVRRMGQDWLNPASNAEMNVLETLARRGFVERQWQSLSISGNLPTISVIIPVKDRADDLRNCLTSLQELEYPQHKLEVVVVDDGSSDDTPRVAEELGAVLVESGQVAGGPALARNKGAAVASGEILAFIDSDCTASQQWLMELLPVFADADVAAVGGRVDGMFTESALDRYEAVMSSLNLGRREMSGGQGGDTFYLPSCNLLMRKEAFTSAGGFRSELHVGEDVDLTWRLRDAGWKIVYLPRGTVFHAHRSKLRPFMKRRFEYGTSEGMLQQLHPVRGKKMILPPMLAAILFLLTSALICQSMLPLPVAAVLLLGDTAFVTMKMRRQKLPISFVMVFLARARSVGSLGYYLGYHLLRYYLVPQLLAAIIYPPIGLLTLVMLLGAGGVDYRVRKARLTPIGFFLYYFLEQLSYGSGVFWGCLQTKSFTSYRLDVNGISQNI